MVIHGITTGPFAEYFIVDDCIPKFLTYFSLFDNVSRMHRLLGEIHTSFGVYDLYWPANMPMASGALEGRL